MSLLIGVPVILPPRPEVLASWTHRPHLIVVNGAHDAWHEHHTDDRPWNETNWNPPRNAGVAASWNNIFERARSGVIDPDITHVALMSQGVILDKGGTSRLAALVDQFADDRGLLTDFAWRCIVLSVSLWEQVGPFDERFYPAYWEDSDYTRRLFLAGLHHPDNPMPKVERDLLDGTSTEAATLQAGLIDQSCYGENHRRFRDKWGGEPFKETYDIPDSPGNSYNPTNNWSSHAR